MLGEADFGDLGAGVRRSGGKSCSDDERAASARRMDVLPWSGWCGWFERIMPGGERNDKEAKAAFALCFM